MCEKEAQVYTHSRIDNEKHKRERVREVKRERACGGVGGVVPLSLTLANCSLDFSLCYLRDPYETVRERKERYRECKTLVFSFMVEIEKLCDESRSEILRLQRAFRKLSDIDEKYAKELRNLSRSDLDFGKNARYLFFIPHTHISSIH